MWIETYYEGFSHLLGTKNSLKIKATEVSESGKSPGFQAMAQPLKAKSSFFPSLSVKPSFAGGSHSCMVS